MARLTLGNDDNVDVTNVVAQATTQMGQEGNVQPLIQDAPDIVAEHGDETSFWKAAGEEFSHMGFVTGAYNLAMQDQFGRYDENFSLADMFDRDQEAWGYVKPFYDNMERPESKALAERLRYARNEDHARYLIDQHKQRMEGLRHVQAHPMGAVLGMFGSVGLDILATGGLNMASGGHLARLLGTTAMTTVKGGFRGAAGSAARVGAAGAGYGAADQMLHLPTDSLATEDDVWMAALWGGVIGAGTGAIIQPLLRKLLRSPENFERHGTPDGMDADEIMDEYIRNRTTGAMASPVDEIVERERIRQQQEVTMAKGGHTVIVGHLPGAKTGMRWWRNAKNVISDMGARGAKEADAGWQGNKRYFDFMSRIYKFTRNNASEVQGRQARMDTFQDHINILRNERAAFNLQVQNKYNDMLEDVEGTARMSVDKILANTSAARAAMSKIGYDTKTISKAEFEAMADEWASVRRHNEYIERKMDAAAGNDLLGDSDVVVRQDQVVPEHIWERLSPEQRTKLLKHIDEMSKEADGYWAAREREAIESGLMKPDEAIDYYRTQVPNRDAISADIAGYRNLLRKVFAAEPDMDWVAAGGYKRIIKNEAGDEVEEALVEAGDTWEDIIKKDPEAAAEIAKDFDLAMKRVLEDKAYEAANEAEELLKIHQKWDGVDFREKFDARIAAAEKRIVNAREKLDSKYTYKGKDWIEFRNAQLKIIGNAESEIKAMRDRTATLDQALLNAEEMTAFTMKYGNKKQKKALQRRVKDVKRASAKNNDALLKKTMDEQIDDVIKSILSETSPARAIDKLQSGNSRLKKRMINLGHHVVSNDARRFYVRDSEGLRDVYTETLGAQVSLRRAWEPLFEREGLKLTDIEDGKLRETFTEMATRGYDQDLLRAQKAGDTKAIKRIQKDKQLALENLKGAIEEIEKTDRLHNIASDEWLTHRAMEFQHLTAMGGLGTMLFSSIGDVANIVMGGHKFGTGIKRFVTPKRTGPILKEIAQKDARTAALITGARNLDMSRIRSLAGVDFATVDIPGSYFRKYKEIYNEAGHLQAMATLMDGWNKRVRNAFGLDFMQQMRDDAGTVWENLSEPRRRFYARHGLGKEDLRDLADLWNRKNIPLQSEAGLAIPDRGAWYAERPDLLQKFQKAMVGAGEEVLLDPSFGDQPFLRSSPIGRMLIQFTSYTFTAAERVIPRITQGLALDPLDPIPILGAISGITMGVMVLYLKAAINGQQAIDRLNSMSPSELVIAGYLRSSLVPGMAGTFLDNAFEMAGENVNSLFGAKVVPEAYSRFTKEQGYMSLFGPTVGMGNTIYRSMMDVTDGNYGKAADKLLKITPLVNTVPARTAMRAFEEITD